MSGGPRILSDAQLDEMAAMRERGWSCERIAEHFTQAGTKIGASAIQWQCLRVGADVPAKLRGVHTQPTEPYRRGKHVVRPFSPEDDAKLTTLEQRGCTVAAISREMQRQPNSIRGRLMTLARREARQEDAA